MKSSKAFQQPLVSVLTPVYNGERYLAKCIESVLGQTYQNWEYIIVNNRSTDHTLAIARDYARRDPRIHITNNEKFVSAVRNHNIALGLMSPLSKYCKFVHADDLLFPTCLSEMVELAEASPSVAIVTSYQLKDRWVYNDGLPYPIRVLPGKELIRNYLLQGDRLWTGNMSAFLLRADLARNHAPLLSEKCSATEVEVYFSLLHEYDCGFVHQILSFQRVGEETLSTFYKGHNHWTYDVLYLTKAYGHTYLTHEEYDGCLKRCIDEYYRCQGRELFRLRERSFWRYHRKMAKEYGFSFSSLLLLKGAVMEAGSALLQPVKAALRQFEFVRNGGAKVRSTIAPKGENDPRFL